MADDLFGSAHDLEQQHIQEGARDGQRDGLRAGLEEGRALGLAKGFEIGVEVGHYAGCVRAWRALQQQQPGAVPARLERAIAAMEELLAGFPLHDPKDERIQDLIEALRGKHKAVLAGLGRGAPEQQEQEQQRQRGGGGGPPAPGALSF